MTGISISARAASPRERSRRRRETRPDRRSLVTAMPLAIAAAACSRTPNARCAPGSCRLLSPAPSKVSPVLVDGARSAEPPAATARAVRSRQHRPRTRACRSPWGRAERRNRCVQPSGSRVAACCSISSASRGTRRGRRRAGSHRSRIARPRVPMPAAKSLQTSPGTQNSRSSGSAEELLRGPTPSAPNGSPCAFGESSTGEP